MLLVSLAIFGCFFAILAHGVSASDDMDSSKIRVTPCDVNDLGQYCCSPFHPEIGCFPQKLECIIACCSKSKNRSCGGPLLSSVLR
ncbi:hypothetical protein GUJ93_ZPchr0001g32837 [Zizania palustris]|uniref:Uncharacterized protein n=1 Tax=Zizania palustris TaxID=103762 RepID=A0A8J5S8J0_ZIZPA|nr:hypothetical protein GUJ93_ZPchr0001g32837 [Zizania palustris]